MDCQYVLIVVVIDKIKALSSGRRKPNPYSTANMAPSRSSLPFGQDPMAEHRQVTITTPYDKRGEAAKVKAAELIKHL